MGEVAAIITGKQLEIHGLPAVSSVSPADEFPLFSNAEQDDRKITFENLKAGVSYTLRPFGVRRLVVTTTDEHTVNVTAAAIFVENPDDGTSLRINALDVSADIEASGAGGLDTGSEAEDTWYYVWVISNGTQTALLLSASDSSPVLPSGYGYRALVSMVRNDVSGTFVPFVQRGTRYVYTAVGFLDKPQVYAGSPSGVEDISSNLAEAVPPQAVSVTFDAYLTATPADVSAGKLHFYYKPDDPGAGVVCRREFRFDSSNGEIIEEWASPIEVPVVIPQTMGVETSAGLYLTLRVFYFDLDL